MTRLSRCRYRYLAPLALATLAGCADAAARYTPTAGEARSSLEAALAAWRDGRPYGEIDATPPVRVVDTAWLSGQKVESFRVLDEQDRDGAKRFSVRLAMKSPRGEKDVAYVVHGRDPVWVYREEDYTRTLNMDNNPQPSPPTRPARRRR
jgi:hypothetical protein